MPIHDDEEKIEVAKWLATLPPAVRALADKYPPTICYRLQVHHCIIIAYTNDETVQVACGADDPRLPGGTIIHVPITELTRCACGKWEWASEDARDETLDRIYGILDAGTKTN